MKNVACRCRAASRSRKAGVLAGVGAVVEGERHVIGPAQPGQPGEQPPPERADGGQAGSGVRDSQSGHGERGERGPPVMPVMQATIPFNGHD